MRKLLMFWLVLPVAAVGLYLTMWPWDVRPIVSGWPLVPPILRHGLPKVGDALIIAATLAILVDRVAKRELLQDFAIDVSHHIIGHRLPTELRDQIFRYLTVDIIRTDWNVTYTLDTLDANPGFVRLTTLNIYELRNTSPQAKKYSHSYSVETSWAPAVGETSIEALALVSVSDDQSFELKRADATLKCKAKDGFVQASREFTIPAMSEAQFRCIAESVEYFPEDFIATFVVLHPVLRTTVTIHYPKELIKVDVNVSAEDGAPPKRVELATGAQWIITTPLLHGQSITTRWGATSSTSTGGRTRGEQHSVANA